MAPPLRMMPSLGVRPLNASQPSSSRSTLGGKGITVGKVGSGGKKMGKSGLKRHRYAVPILYLLLCYMMLFSYLPEQ